MLEKFSAARAIGCAAIDGQDWMSHAPGAEGTKSRASGTESVTGSELSERPGLFDGVLARECQGISASARLRQFVRGEMLHFEGDSIEHVLMLTSGLVKMIDVGMNGCEVILGLGVPGDVFGATALITGCRHGATAAAFRDSTALSWDARTFRGLVDRFPILKENLLRILGRDLNELGRRFREVATERVGQRVALQLMRLSEVIGTRCRGEIRIGVSREELAQMTGTTLFTISRTLSAWEAQGVVTPGRGAVTIRDLQALIRIAEAR